MMMDARICCCVPAMGRYPIDKAIAEVDEADDNESIHSLGNESFTSLGSWDDAHEEEYKLGDDHKGHSPSGSDDDDDDDEEAEEVYSELQPVVTLHT